MPTSTTRLAASLAVHALLLAGGLLWKGSPPPARRVVSVTLRAPSIPAPRAHPSGRPVPRAAAAPAPAATRVFEAPKSAAAATRTLPAEVVLPDAPLPPPVPSPPAPVPTVPSTALPPPPVILGRLSETTVAKAAARGGELRATSFGVAGLEAPSASGKTVAAARFGDIAAAAPERRLAGPAPGAHTSAVQILHKPAPAYTDEARRLRLEGEVVLEVLFPASGEARVLRVIEGLGHGLDEAATQSVAGIRFRPAERDGAAVDQIAIVHIVFRLAY